MLDQLAAEDRLRQALKVKQARLKPLRSKAKLLLGAGFVAMAERWQRRAETIMSMENEH